MFKPFAIEFQPSIEEMAEKEQRVRVCADMATMERIMSLWRHFYIKGTKAVLIAFDRQLGATSRDAQFFEANGRNSGAFKQDFPLV